MPDHQNRTISRRRALRGALAAGLAVGLAGTLAACGSNVSDTAVPQSGFISGDGGVTILPVGERPDAPVVSGPVLGGAEGETMSTQASAGKVLVLNVWGSWCAPCRQEAPELIAAAERTAGKAEFIGLNTRDLDPLPAEAFERSFGVNYPSIYDPSGKLLLEFSDQLPPSGIPSTLVVDTDGKVAARIIGATTASTLVGVVDDVAAGK